MKPVMGILALLIAWPASLVAQPLVNHVPADALIVLSWQGTDHMPQSYQRTHLKAILDESSIEQFITDFLPRAVNRLEAQDRRAAADIRMLGAIIGPMLRHPTALCFAGVDFNNVGGPMPRITLMCQAGAEADGLLQVIEAAMKKAPPRAVPVRLFRRGDIVALSIGYERDEDAVVDPARSLLTSAPFKQAAAQGIQEPVAMLYVDFEGLLGAFDQAVQLSGNEGAINAIPRIKSALGVDGLKRFIWTAGFSGEDFATQAFIQAPAPRAGLLTLLDSPPIADEALRCVPATAAGFSAVRLDLGQMLASFRQGLAQFDETILRGYDQVMGLAQMATGVNFPLFFKDLGDTWIVYTDDNVAGNGPLGMVVVNRLRNAEEAGRYLQKLEVFADNFVNSQLPERDRFHVGFEQVRVGDLNVHYVALPLVAPSWAIKDGNLYMGLYPQVVVSASDAASSNGKSILDNAAFQAMRKKLGVEKPAGISFTNLPQTIGDAYQPFLLLSRVAGVGDLFGVKSPAMILPPLSRVRKYLTPAASASWTDDAGWHSRSLSPFPGAQIMGSQTQLLAAGGALTAAVALPAISRSREAARQAMLMNSLRQMGLAMMTYSTDHQGRFPADLGQIALAGLCIPDLFVVPGGGTAVPGSIRLAAPDAQAAWVNANSDFVYVGAGLNANAPATTALAYLKPEHAINGRLPVLFCDCHVEMLSVPDAMNRIEAQRRK